MTEESADWTLLLSVQSWSWYFYKVDLVGYLVALAICVIYVLSSPKKPS